MKTTLATMLTVTSPVALDLLPNRSRGVYERTYFEFEQWLKDQKIDTTKEPTEEALLTYLQLLSNKYKSTTLWSKYSMLNTCFKSNWGRDLKAIPRLSLFLKKFEHNNGGKKKKAKVSSVC